MELYASNNDVEEYDVKIELSDVEKDMIIIKEHDSNFSVRTNGSEAIYVNGLKKAMDFSVFEGNKLPSKWGLSNNTLRHPLPQFPSITDEDYNEKLKERVSMIISATEEISNYYIKLKGKQEREQE